MPHNTCFKEGKRKHFGEICDLHYVVALLNFFVIAQIFPQYPFFKIIEVEEKNTFYKYANGAIRSNLLSARLSMLRVRGCGRDLRD